jgi:benzylsuccinate CoA-transferase BbsF subunit
MATNAGKPLAGVKVLDFSHVLAGPMCTRLLADLGADVVRIESSKRVDTPWRSTSDPDLKRTYAYVMVHRGKRSTTINLKTPEGAELARKLAGVADVVVENFSAGVMKRLGLDYERLNALNPRLIFLSMSGYGHSGPRKDWTSMNSNLQAYSGLMMVTEREGEPPVSISNSWMDYVGGLHGCYSVMQALAQRRQTGLGRHIDMAQFESGVGTLGHLVLAGIVNRKAPPRTGSRSEAFAPQGCYPCAGKDQWCVISVETTAQWRALVGAMDLPRRFHAADLDSLIHRLREHDAIDEAISKWTASRSPKEVEAAMRRAGVPAERMRRMDELLGGETDSVFHLAPGASGPTLLTGLPFSFRPRKKQEFGKTPRLGEHTDDALREWAGLDARELQRLHDAGVLV